MTLVKTSVLNSIAVLIRLLTLLGINKLLSIYVGPVGYAFLGQYQNLITAISVFASGAINTGVTKYTAEYYYDEEKQHALWRTATAIALIGAIVAFVVALISVQFFIRIVQKKGFAVFGWYRIALGITILTLLYKQYLH